MPPLFSGYLPHILYSVANVSLSLHLVYQRSAFADERARVDAQESILQSIANELRSNSPLSSADLQRLRRLARDSQRDGEDGAEKKISWKDALLGRSSHRRSSDADTS
ncbi:hypothetical protein EV361DRAFT_832889 [Lentinula raphanica]|uniref:Uncharacterized protein n=1 Tax=Lentinula raphanica TaxID=153919 RepID=A0AA38P3M0_9AGAR|nr:hypothetical protein F5880DRAFT_1751766 [Lentinula raphanica]KAJ3835702.1 hypothetical protein F5878DRAFT_627245 [Lentinula raphanica]KAJ3966356.1 hypothetical protein EV361DRAFT_832889 [Lentinula raphanica]